jgi:predicted DNA-binding transcriptional regulator
MMMDPRRETGLTERLERLRGDDTPGCVPEYEDLARGIRSSVIFACALARIKALSDENRLLCMSLLRRRPELCACELQAATGLTHATVSHHMGVLVDAGLVRARRQGKWMYYALAAKAELVLP